MPAVARGSGAIDATRLRLSTDACLRRKLGDWAGAWADGAGGVRAGGGLGRIGKGGGTWGFRHRDSSPGRSGEGRVS